MKEKLRRYFEIVKRINEGQEVSSGDLEFFLTESPEIDDSKMQEFIAADKNATFEQTQAALIEATRKLQTAPEYKDKLLKIATDAKGQKLSDKLATGINLVLGGVDIANSIGQIQDSKRAASKSKRPARPAIPQKSVLLQQALRQAQEGTMDAGRALLPIQAQIQDQYQNDIANAKTASTGQAGNFGAYAQLAADRRNRAALQMAPIQDDIRAREQARYDSLLGMDINENQQMFNNQNSLYNQDLYQYNQDQRAIAELGSVGRENLRGSLYNFGSQLPNAIGNYYSQRKYRNLRNQAAASGLNPDLVENVNRGLEQYIGNYRPNYGVYEQSYIG
jgi:hypothetical protein